MMLFGITSCVAACLFAAVAQAQATATKAKQQKKAPVRSADLPKDELFVWERPFYPISNVPISRSATCSFKQGLAASYETRRINGTGRQEPGRIYYSTTPENESDTVAFLNLDTKTPLVQSNGGQASLIVVHDDGDQLTLLNLQSPEVGIELYTLFRKQGIVIYSQQKESLVLGPFAVLEMGYCH